MARGCTPGLVTRSTFWVGWTAEDGYGDPPEEGDIAINPNTGSCWLIVSVKHSRKGTGWYSIKREGLGIGAVELGDDGTFASVPLRHEDYEMIRQVEEIESAILRGEPPYDGIREA